MDEHSRFIVSLSSNLYLPLLENREAGETERDIAIVFDQSKTHIDVTETDIYDRLSNIVRLSSKNTRRHHSGYKNSYTLVEITIVPDLSEIDTSCDIGIKKLFKRRIATFDFENDRIIGLDCTLCAVIGFFLNANTTIPCSLNGETTIRDLYGKNSCTTIVAYYGGCVIRSGYCKSYFALEPVLSTLHPDNIILHKIECTINGRTRSKLKLRTAEHQV